MGLTNRLVDDHDDDGMISEFARSEVIVVEERREHRARQSSAERASGSQRRVFEQRSTIRRVDTIHQEQAEELEEEQDILNSPLSDSTVALVGEHTLSEGPGH
jgi:hypothetical protein